MEKDDRSSTSCTPQTINSKNTPKRSVIQKFGTPLQRLKENEISKEEPHTKTPVTINPFEVKADALYFSSCSPSVFATFERNKTDNGEFRWSIDHVSLLYPADIDETSIPEPWIDPEHETEAQKAIDAFFSQNSIVPSPWSSESKNRRVAKIRRTTIHSSIVPANDVATQTMLSIPPSVDLLALLGDGLLYNEENASPCSSPTSSNSSSRETDVMSTSSLRRKLFTAEEDCKTPSRLERKDLLLAKQWSTPTINMKSIQSTPSDLLSSSPITPPICSEFCNVRTSPQMSPITGPSSHRSIRMRSFNERLDEESNSQINRPSFDYNHMSESSMSFCIDSQEAVTFQSHSSERQDTGYVTGSMFSLQNTTSDATTSGFQSRITPVTELLDDYGFSSFASNMSCTNENMSTDCENFKIKDIEPMHCGSNKFSLLPNSCSTPAFNL